MPTVPTEFHFPSNFQVPTLTLASLQPFPPARPPVAADYRLPVAVCRSGLPLCRSGLSSLWLKLFFCGFGLCSVSICGWNFASMWLRSVSSLSLEPVFSVAGVCVLCLRPVHVRSDWGLSSLSLSSLFHLYFSTFWIFACLLCLLPPWLQIFAVEIDISKAHSILSIINRLLKDPKFDPNVKFALKNCLDRYLDTPTILEEGLDALKKRDYSTANIRASAALDSSVSCNDSFEEKKVTSPFAKESDDYYQITVVSLAITVLLKWIWV